MLLIKSIIILTLSISSLGLGMSKEIRVYNDFKIPFDPVGLNTMPEYNLSLCLFDTIFEFEDGTNIKGPLFENWVYESSEKAYRFVIAKTSKWSDGKPLKSEDIFLSLTRLKSVGPQHYTGLSSLIEGDIESKGFKIVSEREFLIYVKEASFELFKRLASASIVVVRKDQLDPETMLIKRNDISLAGFTVASNSTTDELVLTVNPHYYRYDSRMPTKVLMRKPLSNFESSSLSADKLWPNLIMDLSFVPKDLLSKLKNRFGVWTRPVDRVLQLVPSPQRFEQWRLFLQWLAYEISIGPIEFEAYENTHKALSLQPPGFILHDPIKYKKVAKPKLSDKKIKVAYLPRMPIHLVKQVFARLSLQADFTQVTVQEYFKNPKRFDFFFSSFGAADPSPVIWLNMVLENQIQFIADYDYELRNEYRSIKTIQSDTERNIKLTKMLKEAGERGFYLPIAHFSSIAIYDKNISFEEISQVDETIDITKLRFYE